MRKFVLIPDSFKGTMSSSEICEIMARELRSGYPDAKIVSIPAVMEEKEAWTRFFPLSAGKGGSYR